MSSNQLHLKVVSETGTVMQLLLSVHVRTANMPGPKLENRVGSLEKIPRSIRSGIFQSLQNKWLWECSELDVFNNITQVEIKSKQALSM